MSKEINFDVNEALAALRAGKDLNGKDGILTPLIKQLTEAALQAELEQHLDQEAAPNRRNGSTPKTVKTPSGDFALNTPRDRTGTFEPQIVKKNQTHLTDELERKILSLYAHGNRYQTLREHIQDLYDMSLSNGTLNAITDKLIPEFNSWRERDLDSVYPIVWLDAIHYKIKENGRFVSKALYTILALNIEGKKELLGLYLSDAEGAHYWLSVLTDLQNRGVKDILIACVDGLTGFPEAMGSMYPDTEVQWPPRIRSRLWLIVRPCTKPPPATPLKPLWMICKPSGASRIPLCCAPGATSGKICRFTSSIRKRFAKPFTPPVPWKPYTANCAN